MLLVLPLLAGCSGLGASGSISPATFLLPGFTKAAPPAPDGVPLNPPGPSLAVALSR